MYAPCDLSTRIIVVSNLDDIVRQMAQAFAPHGKRYRLLLAQCRLNQPLPKAGRLTARRTTERLNLLHIQTVTPYRLIVLHILRFHPPTVVPVGILNQSRRRNRLQRCTRINKLPVLDIGVGINSYRVAVGIHHQRKRLAVPHRQASEHAGKVVQQLTRLSALRQVGVNRKTRFLSAKTVIDKFIAIFGNAIKRPLIDVRHFQTTRQRRVAWLRQHIVKNPCRVIRPSFFKRSVPHRRRIGTR